MIRIAAFKPSTSPRTPSRDDYTVAAEVGGKATPLLLLTALTGFVLYLKSLLHSKAQTPASDDEKAAPRATDDEVTQADPELEAPDAVGSLKDPDDVPRTGSNGNVYELPARITPAMLESFLANEAAIDFHRLNLSPPTAQVVEQIAERRVSNDNHSSGTGGSGSGGGGGGHSRSSGESTDKPDNAPTVRQGGDDTRLRPSGPDPVGPAATPQVDNIAAGPSPSGETPAGPFGPGVSRNHAPRTNGSVRLADTAGCQAYLISLAALLSGASDIDGDVLRINNVTSSTGTITPTADGNWEFRSEPFAFGEVTLTFSISDGVETIQQTAYFRVLEQSPIIGTAFDDALLGTACADIIDGAAGDDNIVAREGNDLVEGGSGNDHIIAGEGNDIVFAGAGDDIVFAGAGNDIVYGGAGNDRLFGENGDDVLHGDDGDDVVSGGDGADTVFGDAGNDTLHGDQGNDIVDGGAGNDTLDGGDGQDVLLGQAGDDTLMGGAGNDLLSDGAGADTVSGGDGDDHVLAASDAAPDVYGGDGGVDTLDYSAASFGIIVDMEQGTAKGFAIGDDRISGFEILIGGQGDDRLAAGSAPMTLKGGEGNDILSDGAGSDVLSGGGGDDRIVAAIGFTTDSFQGDDGMDTLDYSAAILSVFIDIMNGSAHGQDIGDDLISGFESIVGGHGADRFLVGEGSISLTGGEGDDVFEFDAPAGSRNAELVRKITDFMIGDRIVVRNFNIYASGHGSEETGSDDPVVSLYLTDGGDDQRAVRFHFETIADQKMTMVDIGGGPEAFEAFSIELVGFHQLEYAHHGS